MSDEVVVALICVVCLCQCVPVAGQGDKNQLLLRRSLCSRTTENPFCVLYAEGGYAAFLSACRFLGEKSEKVLRIKVPADSPVLPPCCRRAAAMLPPCCRHAAAMLPLLSNRILNPFCPSSAHPLPILCPSSVLPLSAAFSFCINPFDGPESRPYLEARSQ